LSEEVGFGGKKLLPETIGFPVLCSSSNRAFLAMPPPYRAATMFLGMPTACSVSAICRVLISASAVKINSASVM
jgi:hypothetical protein